MPQPKRIPSLDGLRAVSILMVLLGHAVGTIPHSSHLLQRIEPYVGNSHLGVLAFFVISGYLITYLLKKEWDATQSINLRAFYTRRVLRIFPAFYAYLAVVALLTALGFLHISGGHFACAGLFLWNYNPLLTRGVDDSNWFLGHFWTLSLEEQFYLLWPLTLLLCRPARASRVALAIILLTPPLRVVSYFLFPSVRPQLGIMLHTAADPIMFGCLVALLQGTRRFESLMESVCRAPIVAGAAVYVLLASPYLSLRLRGLYWTTVGLTLESAGLVLIMLWLIRRPETAAGRFFNAPLLVHVGVLSYSLYLWQQLLMTRQNHTWTGVFPLNLLVCFAVAEASYHLIEQPFLRLRKQLPSAGQPNEGEPPEASSPPVEASR